MLILLKVHTNTPNIRDFRSKTYSRVFLQAEYTKNSGYLMRFFRKIGKFVIIGEKLGLKTNKLGRKLRKIEFFAKTVDVLKSFALQLVAQVTIVENTENSQNSRLYTIQHKSGEILTYYHKNLAFPQVPQQLHFKKRKLLTHKNLKGAINCSHAYCEEDYGKCYKHAPFFFKRTIVSNWCHKRTKY